MLWTIQCAIEPANAKHYELNLVDRAYPDSEDDEIHLALLEAISRKY